METMMLAALPLLFLSSCLPAFVIAQGPADPRLTGTWTTKSMKVFTGSAFYDPIKDRLKEPSLTGISYSFTADGFYEEAYFRAVSNPTTPECPSGIMQFQHGTYRVEPNGSMILTPFDSDGRQLISNRCAGKYAEYTRYTQKEVFQRYEILIDPYNRVERLNMFQFDGSPLNPMYLALRQPQMHPTHTLNPIHTTKGAPRATAISERKANAKKAKRSEAKAAEFEFAQSPLSKNSFVKRMNYYHSRMEKLSGTDKLWWIGLIMTSVGSLALIYR
ncbi:conserved hypothetical protein [Histoplasma capsulatum var. duboisii H88]|uniref:Protein ROT1 n=1 Tax=Ajellomyces capsulatus (strain H88) TaxID=544711 RepID=F0U6U7_AJEC8|nr:conserved hypothetical protein [Histoplasma capsulatum var. duboisii H88]QSS52047.1 Rot1 chaperone for protein-folding within the ER [Histoplasma capsulatum var. duboisii H88]